MKNKNLTRNILAGILVAILVFFAIRSEIFAQEKDKENLENDILDIQNIIVENENNEKTEQNTMTNEIQDGNTNDNNSDNGLNVNDTNNLKLQIMRINKEGINPNFDPNIKEYYLVIETSVESLEVTAVPENADINVAISGNENLKEGLNEITIRLESKDKNKTGEYKIYITKTDNKETANTNLETLAIKETFPLPAFDINVTNYDIEVSNEIESLEILAIPQNPNAKIEIEGSQGLKLGKNTVIITVTAENGITTKKYQINVNKK